MERSSLTTPVGTFGITLSSKGLKEITFDTPTISDKEDSSEMKKLKKQILRVLDGKLDASKITTFVNPSSFQKKVWLAISNIPYGETRSYSDIARQIGHPKAYRAVGTTAGQNPIPLVVPCHRVIKADGTVGSYAGGTKMKKKLLRLEGVEV